MAWVSQVNAQYGINAEPAATYALVHNYLQALGWTVTMSGDGLGLFSAVGSILTSGDGPIPLAGSLANYDAWFVIRAPNGVELLVQRGNAPTATYRWLWAVSHGAPFAGGDATHRPVSADEHGIPQDPPAVLANSLGNDAGLNSYYHMITVDAAVEGQWPIQFFKTRLTDGVPLGGLFSWVLREMDAGDTANLVWRGIGATYLSATELDIGTYAKTLADPAGAATWDIAYADQITINASRRVPGVTVPPPDAMPRTKRAGWWTTQGGFYQWKGYSDVVWSPDSSVANPWNHLWRDQNGAVYLAVDGGAAASDGVLLPGWPDVTTCPLPDLGAGVVLHDMLVLDGAAGGDVTAPTITVVSPPVGSTIRPSDPFVVDITDAGGFAIIALTVEIPAGGAHEVVWLRGDFSAAYADASTITAIVDGFRFYILRRNGWTASPTFHVEAVDNAGNVGA